MESNLPVGRTSAPAENHHVAHNGFRDLFRRFSNATAAAVGSPWAFLIAALTIIVWAITGPIFKFSDTWQLVINTGTTIVTFLMVFLIQNTQNRDARAIHLKLDELIKGTKRARNKLVDLEECSDEEIEQLEQEFREFRNRRPSDDPDESESEPARRSMTHIPRAILRKRVRLIGRRQEKLAGTQNVNKYRVRIVRKMKGFIDLHMAQDRRDYPATIRQRMTERWAQRRLGKIDHERRVCEIATSLFELTQSFHRLDSYEKRLLELASIVHDIGRKVDVKHHPAVGSKMILADNWLPLNESERRAVAYLTRYHRGAVPEVGFDEILTAGENRRRMRLVLAMLRAADALDGRQHEAPRLVFALLGKELSVTVYLEEDTPKARRFFKRRKKFRLLEDLLGLKVDLEIRHAHVIHTVS